MTDLYELRITLKEDATDTGNQWYVDHRFTTLPEPETIEALRDEAVSVYRLLFDGEPVVQNLAAVRLDAKEEPLAPVTEPA